MADLVIQALALKRTFGTQRAAGFLRNRGFTASEAVCILARPVRVVVPWARVGV
jgi:hypothetical protein